jgi:mannose-6-phosphate isomerase
METNTESGSGLKEPLRFERILLEKLWGGRRLGKYGVELPAEASVGESWELADRSECASQVACGTYKGRSLRGLMLSEERAILGDSKPSRHGYFPLLVKYLDASESLSVQVHPDHKEAERLSVTDGGKSECWYILEAEPGALIYLGLRPEVDATTFAKNVRGDDVADMLQSYPVERGQFVFVPAGTVHAVGAGITLVEIQENSDITLRIHDWGRTDENGESRELHIDDALLATDYDAVLKGPAQPTFTDCGDSDRKASLGQCDTFSVELLDITGEYELDPKNHAQVYVVTRGHGELILPGDAGRWELGSGDTWLIPASLGVHRVESRSAEFHILRATARD